MRPIALLTDFGTIDHYAGSMKAAIFNVNPHALIVDITHHIPPGDKVCGAFSLLMSYGDFPKSTIFVAVIDPGVGGKRNAIAVKCGDYIFIGPDNGVLSMACDDIAAPVMVRMLKNARYFRNPVSATFHGRDIFGPIAAHLSKGVAFENLGPMQGSFLRCRLPRVIIEPHRIKGSVAYIDHFGNCITTITAFHLQEVDYQPVITIREEKGIALCSSYNEVPNGNPLGIIGSTGFLEVSINCGNAAKTLKVKCGDPVKVDAVRKTLKLYPTKTDTLKKSK